MGRRGTIFVVFRPNNTIISSEKFCKTLQEVLRKLNFSFASQQCKATLQLRNNDKPEIHTCYMTFLQYRFVTIQLLAVPKVERSVKIVNIFVSNTKFEVALHKCIRSKPQLHRWNKTMNCVVEKNVLQ